MNATSRPQQLLEELEKTIIGQHDIVEAIVLAIVANGHVLLEGPPGLAKTLACRALAAALGGVFKRIQFTPDLLPSDIVGTRIFDQRAADFTTVLGPIFANVVLADEINRAPAKVQSALLEAMQERQVTIGPESHRLPDPFIVTATMNPLDSDGTYALPPAQNDRFLLNVQLRYPGVADEIAILDRFGGAEPPLPVGEVGLADVQAWRGQARSIHLDERIKGYIVALVGATRERHVYIEHGASPRATLALAALGRAKALLEGRTFVLPDDVRALAPAVLRHRVAFSYRLAAERGDPEAVLRELIASVNPP